MRILMIVACVAVVGSIGLVSAWACCPAPPGWDEMFPEIAALARHFEVRMRSQDASVRQRVLTELMSSHPRDSKLYPPFLRYLLNDPSPDIRWEAVSRLRDHGIFLTADELPESFSMPIAGLCRPRDPENLERIRAMATADPHSPAAGWAVTALAAAQDHATVKLLAPLTDSENVYVRYSAATAYVQLGKPEMGLPLLRSIAETDTDASGYYKLRSAEWLVRAGETEYMRTLIDATAHRCNLGYADSGLSILEDLTGEYFPTAAEWQAWWEHRKAITTEGCR